MGMELANRSQASMEPSNDLESQLTDSSAPPARGSVSHRSVALTLLATVGTLLMVVGAIDWFQSSPGHSWQGPVQCVAVRSTQQVTRSELCGEAVSSLAV